MDPPANEPAKAGTKRKFSIFSMEQEIVTFVVDDQKFSIHKGLLDHVVTYWYSDFSTVEDVDSDLLYKLPDTSAWAFRGFVHWLYTGKLPTQTVLEEEKEFPQGFDIGNESEPLACSMAVELSYIGVNLDCDELQDQAISYLFRVYQKEPVLPDERRINRIFCGPKPSNAGYLRDFCVGLCNKREVEYLSLIANTNQMPSTTISYEFLSELSISQLTKQYQKPLSLHDFHWHMSEDTSYCSCKKDTNKKEFIIH